MFRSPLDNSSESEAESSDEHTTSNDEATGSAEIIERQATNTESVVSNGEYSTEQPGDALPQLNANGQHASYLLAALLEERSRTRAAAILNASNPGASYTEHSREIRSLAGRIFQQQSALLSSHGVLPAAYTGPEVQRNLSPYLEYVDRSTINTLQDSAIMPNAQYLNTLLPASVANLSLGPQFPIPMPSPHHNMMLSTRFAPQFGRYQAEFQQVRLLGQGGYGQVFHAINAFDRQHYAIKRIPLSAKVYSRWMRGGDAPLRTFREIHHLAQLDHPNVVRYHTAWVEAPLTVSQEGPRSTSSSQSGHQKLLADRPALAETPNRTKNPRFSYEASDGVVFEEDSEYGNSKGKKVERAVQQLIAEMPSRDHQTTSAHSMHDSDIFTDGRSRGRSVAPIEHDINTPILCVQMGLHPMTLSTYLSSIPTNTDQPLSNPMVRHCFHLLPSLRLLLGIICGLQYLHAMNIVHRDIKPGNILLSESSGHHGHVVGFHDVGTCLTCPGRKSYFLNPRIADFGLVAEIEKSCQLEPALPYRAAGTELYRPPDSSAESVNEKLDVFALGILFFEILWKFGTKSERVVVLSQLQKGEVPETFSARLDVDCGAGIGKQVTHCIKGMISKSPAQRWSLDQVREWAKSMEAKLEKLMAPYDV